MTTITPVQIELIRGAFVSAAEDMNTALIRSSYTPTIYEAKDCAVALLDRHHQILGQSSGLPIFLGNLEVCSKYTEERFGSDIWRPGDVWVLNDSYIGGTHLNDVTVFAPIFSEDATEHLGFAASRAHWIDMGSKDPGGSMDSTSIYQEGIRLSPIKIYEGGEPCLQVHDLIAANVRFPEPTLGDMRAQVACARIGERRLQELHARWGTEVLDLAATRIFAQSEALERERIAQLPDGVYRASGYLDNDGIALDEPLEVVVEVRIVGDRITIDVTESADQAMGPVNCGSAQTVSACRVAYKAMISSEFSLNGGSFEPLDVLVREGSMLGAQDPAACQYYYSHLGLLIDLVIVALSDAIPDQASAASYGDSMIVQFAGTDARSGELFVSQEATVGGWGGNTLGDGESALINNVNGSLRDMPVEVLETLYPVRVREYALRPGSGGAGRYRGGLGVIREYEFTADQSLSLWWERSVTPAWGVQGGKAGAPPRVVLDPGTPNEQAMLKVNAIPVTRGQILRCESGGGGGFGDPTDRASDAAEQDRLEGLLHA